MISEINDFINNDYKALDCTESIAEVNAFFEQVAYSHFPVLDDGIYIGSVAAEYVETFDFDKKINDYKYGLDGFFARKSMIWLDVLEVFAKNHTNIVPVLDENNLYSGYYELEDVVRFFSETPFLKEQGGIIIVKKEILDYSMSQIVQIVESNNGKVLGTFISDADVSTVTITVKIASGSINEIIQTFRRYNYEIVSEHQDDNYLASLKERSDYLEKYLNI